MEIVTRRARAQYNYRWRVNLLSIYRLASAEDIRAGVAWYQDANNAARRMAEKYDVTVECAAGVIAALSPSLPWERNLEEADRFLATWRLRGRDVLRDSFGVYGSRNKEKAYRIVRGESPLEVLASRWGYLKVISFYHCIIEPTNSEWITIDGHAKSAANGERFGLHTDDALVKPAHYKLYSRAYREASAEVGLTPAQFQAVIWVVWRRQDVGETVKALMAAA